MAPKLEVFLRSLVVGVVGGILTGALLLGIAFAGEEDDAAERLEGFGAGMAGGAVYGAVVSLPFALVGAGVLVPLSRRVRTPAEAWALGAFLGLLLGAVFTIWFGSSAGADAGGPIFLVVGVPMIVIGAVAGRVGCFGLRTKGRRAGG